MSIITLRVITQPIHLYNLNSLTCKIIFRVSPNLPSLDAWFLKYHIQKYFSTSEVYIIINPLVLIVLKASLSFNNTTLWNVTQLILFEFNQLRIGECSFNYPYKILTNISIGGLSLPLKYQCMVWPCPFMNSVYVRQTYLP